MRIYWPAVIGQGKSNLFPHANPPEYQIEDGNGVLKTNALSIHSMWYEITMCPAHTGILGLAVFAPLLSALLKATCHRD